MPRRDDLQRVMVLGAGPIVIGQACEFDYSGTQACKALKEEGFEVVLLNSNPATIMTDPELADRTYVEPINLWALERILERERPDAVLTTLGGQTALNLAVEASEAGLFDRFGVEMIGADLAAIHMAEARQEFRRAMEEIGLAVPRSTIAGSLEAARAAVEETGFPSIVRPSFTLGGTGGGVARTPEEFDRIVQLGLQLSLTHEVLIEQSVIGWKEFELEVMRDKKDNVVIICSIENVDPMGVHTGDSITVAPAQTLTDREYQIMRDAAIACIRKVGVETGGSNIQFALDPQTGDMVVIEMNPRLSRSSALASKATGFPIAKFAAKLAVGYTLDEIPNDITRETPASFEPTIDYCVVKIPRFAFEKFPEADPTLTTQMKSVGEVMAIGRTFTEALQKGMRGLEIKADGFQLRDAFRGLDKAALIEALRTPNAERLFQIRHAFELGATVEELYEATAIDPWFLASLARIVEQERQLTGALGAAAGAGNGADAVGELLAAKRFGFSDAQIGAALGASEGEVRARRKEQAVLPTYKPVDTCAAEFEAYTPYYYSTYEEEDEVPPSDHKRVIILGGGPNRIGQGIEFDYCCCQAAFGLDDAGYESIMVNCNPETVSTDYDTSTRLYFEPLTLEDVLNIVDKERPDGVIVQFGGQTPLNLAGALEAAGVPIAGTACDAIDRAEDRSRFAELLSALGLVQPPNGTAVSVAEAEREAERIGYPVLLRPSYVLGGRAMEIVYDTESLRDYMARAVEVSGDRPVLIDSFLEGATEVDVDLIGDGATYLVGGVMEHIEEAGVHSGDSACCLPPHSLPDTVVQEIKRQTVAIARELSIIGLMNVQFAVKDGRVFVLEVNPRASRTVPFVSKAIGVPLARIAAKVMVGVPLADMDVRIPERPERYAVKEAVLPFSRFHGIDVVLGPEMKSTGEVMGADVSFGKAFAKAQMGAGSPLPVGGNVFLSVRDEDKRHAGRIGRSLEELGFRLFATRGTAAELERAGVAVSALSRVSEGSPNVVEMLERGEVALVINTPGGKKPRSDGVIIRSLAVARGVPCITTVPGAFASISGMRAMASGQLQVMSLQEQYATAAANGGGPQG